MGRIRFFIFIIIILFTFFPTQKASAQQSQNNSSYFSFFKNFVIAFTAIDEYNQYVLGAHTQQKIQPTTTLKQPLSEPALYLLTAVNAYRLAQGIGSVQTNSQVCTFAALRAKEIAISFNHDGFNSRTNAHTLPYSRWSRATENIAESPDYRQVVTLWTNSPGHAANMRDNTPFVCIRRFGNFYAYEGMRP